MLPVIVTIRLKTPMSQPAATSLGHHDRSMTMVNAHEITVSVVIPLLRAREADLDGVAAWTRQTLGAGRVEVVAVSRLTMPRHAGCFDPAIDWSSPQGWRKRVSGTRAPERRGVMCSF
jgi:hypothetical protein